MLDPRFKSAFVSLEDRLSVRLMVHEAIVAVSDPIQRPNQPRLSNSTAYIDELEKLFAPRQEQNDVADELNRYLETRR